MRPMDARLLMAVIGGGLIVGSVLSIDNTTYKVIGALIGLAIIYKSKFY